MLTLCDRRPDRNCQGLTRRELLKIGGLGFGGLLTLPHLLAVIRLAENSEPIDGLFT